MSIYFSWQFTTVVNPKHEAIDKGLTLDPGFPISPNGSCCNMRKHSSAESQQIYGQILIPFRPFRGKQSLTGQKGKQSLSRRDKL